jgi:hypothetical protein
LERSAEVQRWPVKLFLFENVSKHQANPEFFIGGGANAGYGGGGG